MKKGAYQVQETKVASLISRKRERQGLGSRKVAKQSTREDRVVKDSNNDTSIVLFDSAVKLGCKVRGIRGRWCWPWRLKNGTRGSRRSFKERGRRRHEDLVSWMAKQGRLNTCTCIMPTKDSSSGTKGTGSSKMVSAGLQMDKA